jgi:hypothetical protein
MRPGPETIRLGTHEWPVRPLTLRQVQEIEPILMSSAAEKKGNVAAAMAIVAIALGRDHADAAALLGDIEATAPEIGAAMATVLRLGGFMETPTQGDAGLGEAQAGEVHAKDPPASISASSTQDS